LKNAYLCLLFLISIITPAAATQTAVMAIVVPVLRKNGFVTILIVCEVCLLNLKNHIPTRAGIWFE